MRFLASLASLALVAFSVTAVGLQVAGAGGYVTLIYNIHSTATTSAFFNVDNQNPYSPASARLVFSDPLSDIQPDDFVHSRIDFKSITGTTCIPTDTTLKVSSSIDGQYGYCLYQDNRRDYSYNQSKDYADFAFEVKMRIVGGDTGGIVFRFQENNKSGGNYVFDVKQDGTCRLILHPGKGEPVDLSNGKCNGKNIHKGLEQTNTIAVAADGSVIRLYINDSRSDVFHITDSTYITGEFGVIAAGSNGEVFYNDAKLWAW